MVNGTKLSANGRSAKEKCTHQGQSLPRTLLRCAVFTRDTQVQQVGRQSGPPGGSAGSVRVDSTTAGATSADVVGVKRLRPLPKYEEETGHRSICTEDHENHSSSRKQVSPSLPNLTWRLALIS